MEQEAIVSFQSQNKSTVHARPGLFGTPPTALARSSEPWVSLLLLLPPWWFLRCFLLLRGALSGRWHGAFAALAARCLRFVSRRCRFSSLRSPSSAAASSATQLSRKSPSALATSTAPRLPAGS
jgi:hypothetical protein